MGIIANKEIPLEVLLTNSKFIVRGVTPRYHYENGQKTDEIEGHVFDVVNAGSFDDVRVMVTGATSIVTNEQVVAARESGAPIMVEFVNATIRAYVNPTSHRIEETVKAEAVNLLVKD